MSDDISDFSTIIFTVIMFLLLFFSSMPIAWFAYHQGYDAGRESIDITEKAVPIGTPSLETIKVKNIYGGWRIEPYGSLEIKDNHPLNGILVNNSGHVVWVSFKEEK